MRTCICIYTFEYMHMNKSTYVCVLVDQKGCTITVEYLETFHILKHLYIHTYIHTYIYAYIYININICISVCKCIKICIYMVNQKGRTITVEWAEIFYIPILVYVHTYIYIYAYTYMNVYNCIYVYKYIKICMFVGEPRRAHDHCRIPRNVSCCHVRAKQWRQTAGIRCNTVNESATNCNPLQHTVTPPLQHSETQWNTVKHTAMHCNILSHCTLQHSETQWNRVKHSETQCNTLQFSVSYCHTTHCNTLKHIATH